MEEPQNQQQKTETNQNESEQKPKEIIKEIHHHHYKESRFNFGRLLFGLLIIIIGLVFLAQSAGWLNKIDFDWWQLWPVLIIFFGLSILSGRGWISAAIGVVVTLIVLGIVALLVFGNFNLTNKATISEPISINKETDAQSAVINIKTGAGNLNIAGGSEALVSGTLESNFLTLKDESKLEDSVQTITLKTEGSWSGFSRHINNLDLKLNTDTLMKLNIDSGAIDSNLDLSQVRTEEININTGASALKLTLGDKADNSKLKINAGASSIDITLPKTLGAKLTLDSGLTSKDLKDFKQIDSKNYESDNYGTASKKIDMDFDLGATSLKINWE